MAPKKPDISKAEARRRGLSAPPPPPIKKYRTVRPDGSVVYLKHKQDRPRTRQWEQTVRPQRLGSNAGGSSGASSVPNAATPSVGSLGQRPVEPPNYATASGRWDFEPMYRRWVWKQLHVPSGRWVAIAPR